MTVDEIRDAIKDLGWLHETHFSTKGVATSEMNRLLPMFYGDDYNITDIMLYLTPECSRLLISCTLHKRRRNCSDIFSVQLTSAGFCCTFNYFPGDNKDNATYEFVETVGVWEGLEVIMDPMLDDYFFTMMPTVGIKAMLFNTRNYPEMLSGGVSEVLVSPNTKRYVRVEARALFSSNSIRSFPMRERACVFPDEEAKNADVLENCIMACIDKEIWKYCKCRPFQHSHISVKQFNRTCTLEDGPCMYNVLGDVRNIVPYETTEIDENLLKATTKLFCNVCYPPCNDIGYGIKSVSLHAQKKPPYSDINVTAYTNYSILAVYFSNSRTLSLRKDVAYKWFQYISDVGGICELFLGCSLISFVELVYFIILCLTDLLTSDSDPEENGEFENQQVQPPMQVIYWNELCPSSRFMKPFKRIRKSSKNS